MKKFLHAYSYLPAIPRGRLILGVFVGLLFAFSFYAFLYVCRETLRVFFFMTDDFDLLVLSDEAVTLFNFILAYIATILGQSLCFTYWFETPLTRLGKYAPRMRAVINDQRSMNSYFLSWFSRLGYTFALLIGGTMGGGIYVAHTFSDYKYVLALAIIVLFLHTWINLRRLFNGKSFKWMMISATLLSVLSLGMSRINLIDYKRINEIILSKNLTYTHHLKLPESACFERMNSEGKRRATLWIAEEKNVSGVAEPIIWVNHTGMRYPVYGKVQVPLDSLKLRFASWDKNLREESMHEPCVLYVHRDIKMSRILQIKKILAELQAYRMQYAVLPPEREYDDRYYTSLVFPLITDSYYSEPDSRQLLRQEMDTAKHVFDLRIIEPDKVLLDNIEVNRNDFKDFIRQKILSFPDYRIRYYIDGNSTYAEYIFIVSSIMQAISQIRNNYSLEVYRKEYEELEWEDSKVVRRKFPYRVVEVSFGLLP